MINLSFNKTDNPNQSGTYLAVVEIDGDLVVTQADYCKAGNLWTVECFQVDTTLPHNKVMEEAYWQPIPVKCIAWTNNFPWSDFNEH